MNTSGLPLRKLSLVIASLVFANAAFAADLVLQKIPSSSSTQGDALSVAYINYNLKADATAKPRALYVSSGDDVKQAATIVSEKPAAPFSFSAGDPFPTAVIDLGKAKKINRVSTISAAQKGSVAVYVLNALPDSSADADPADLPNILKISSEAVAHMVPVGLVETDGTRPETSIEFAATTGRYVMVRWNPAQKDGTFTLAQIAASGSVDDQNTTPAKHRYNDVTDSKTVADTKSVTDTKDIPEEGPIGEGPPAEGPPPGLPPPPPFTFIPQIVPVSP